MTQTLCECLLFWYVCVCGWLLRCRKSKQQGVSDATSPSDLCPHLQKLDSTVGLIPVEDGGEMSLAVDCEQHVMPVGDCE